MPRSAVPLSTIVATPSVFETFRRNTISGWWVRNSRSIRGSMYTAMVLLAPTVTGPVRSPAMRFISVSSSLYSSKIWRAYSYTLAPDSVNVMRLCVRSNRRVL